MQMRYSSAARLHAPAWSSGKLPRAAGGASSGRHAALRQRHVRNPRHGAGTWAHTWRRRRRCPWRVHRRAWSVGTRGRSRPSMSEARHSVYWFPGGKLGRWAENRVLIDSDAAFAHWAAREDPATGLPLLRIYPRFEASASKRAAAVAADWTAFSDDPPPAAASASGADDDWAFESEHSEDWFASSSDESSSSQQQPTLVSRHIELRRSMGPRLAEHGARAAAHAVVATGAGAPSGTRTTVFAAVQHTSRR